MKLEDNPEGHFIETIMAASAELERNRNKRQVCNRMKARLEIGYWIFDSPPGYKYLKDPMHGKILVPDEPKASIIREALEGYALGRFVNQQDVQAFLNQKKFTHRGKFKKVHLVQVKRILTRALYAGIIDYPAWGIQNLQGKHDAIVSKEIFNKAQEKLLGRAKKSFSRQSIHVDFPIRGFVLCSGCEKPLTASWSRGRKNKYPYYRCNNKACRFTQKSIKKETLEGAFGEFLKKAAPPSPIINLAKALTLEIYDEKAKQKSLEVGALESELTELEKRIRIATDKFINATSPAIQSALERQIEELENQRQELEQTIQCKKVNVEFGTALEAVMTFIGNPYDTWVSGDLNQKSAEVSF